MWVFGYGSLLWYQDFPVEQSLTGVVRGYSRRFWQLSPDHRGTPEKPGRTVTLVKDVTEDATCWGKAFKVPKAAVPETIKYLDHREKAGYVRIPLMFYPDDKNIEPFEVETYMNISDEDHKSSDSEVVEIATTIVQSTGPSGPNIEYLLRLSSILRNESPVPDPHVFDLEKKVIVLCEERSLDYKPYMVAKVKVVKAQTSL